VAADLSGAGRRGFAPGAADGANDIGGLPVLAHQPPRPGAAYFILHFWIVVAAEGDDSAGWHTQGEGTDGPHGIGPGHGEIEYDDVGPLPEYFVYEAFCAVKHTGILKVGLIADKPREHRADVGRIVYT